MHADAADTPAWTWDLGSYEPTAAILEPLADVLIDRLDPGPGTELLDLGTGTGNVALAAARTGASVTAVDLATRLLGVARDRAHDEGVPVSWVVGDLHDLPFVDASFDVITSVSAAVLVPDPRRTAEQLVRVLRPGGRAVLSSWDARSMPFPAGMLGDERYPAVASGEPGWFGEPEIRALLDGLPVDVAVDEHSWSFSPEDVADADGFVEHLAGNHPMLVQRRAEIDASDWDREMAELRETVEGRGRVVDGRFELPATALLIELRRHDG